MTECFSTFEFTVVRRDLNPAFYAGNGPLTDRSQSSRVKVRQRSSRSFPLFERKGKKKGKKVTPL